MRKYFVDTEFRSGSEQIVGSSFLQADFPSFLNDGDLVNLSAIHTMANLTDM